jgi:hypothetical protein
MEKPIQITDVPNENLCYPLVNVYITMENYNFLWVNQRTTWQFSIAMLAMGFSINPLQGKVAVGFVP